MDTSGSNHTSQVEGTGGAATPPVMGSAQTSPHTQVPSATGQPSQQPHHMLQARMIMSQYQNNQPQHQVRPPVMEVSQQNQRPPNQPNSTPIMQSSQINQPRPVHAPNQRSMPMGTVRPGTSPQSRPAQMQPMPVQQHMQPMQHQGQRMHQQPQHPHQQMQQQAMLSQPQQMQQRVQQQQQQQHMRAQMQQQPQQNAQPQQMMQRPVQQQHTQAQQQQQQQQHAQVPQQQQHTQVQQQQQQQQQQLVQQQQQQRTPQKQQQHTQQQHTPQQHHSQQQQQQQPQQTMQPTQQPQQQQRPPQTMSQPSPGSQQSQNQADYEKGWKKFTTFRTKLFSLAKEDESISKLWYAHGKQVREAHPKMDTKDLLPLIVKAVWEESHRDKELMQRIWSHNPPAVPQKTAQQAQQGQAATVAAQGSQQVQGAQPMMQGVRPGSAMYQHQRYPVAAGTGPQQAQMQYQYSQYVQQQGARPTAYQTPLTEAQIAEQRRLHDEQMERNKLENERRMRENEEKRQKAAEEARRRAEEKERQRKMAEDQRLEQKRQKELEKQQKLAEREQKRADKAKQREEEKERKRQEREAEKQRKALERASAKGPKRKNAASRSGSGKGPSTDGGGLVPLPDSTAKKRAASRPSGGIKKKAKVDSDQPLAIPVDIDNEEAALLGAMLKMGQQQGHKPVLEEDAVLNDAPLRSRMLHVAAGHGVHLVHAGAVKACSVAVEMYLREILQQMIRVHAIRTKQAKDVPGMARDTSRNWARDVAIIAEEEKESQLRARHEQQLQQDQRTIAAHQNRRRGAELDEEEKAKRKETVDAAKSRLHNAEAQSRVNESLQKILPMRRFGQGRRLFGASLNNLRGGALPNVKAKQATGVAGGTTQAAAAGTAAPGEGDASTQRPLATKISDVAGNKKTKQSLTMQDLLSTLRHNPVHAHSQLHYELQHMQSVPSH